MLLTRLALELVEVLPGNVTAVTDRLARIMDRAETRAAEGLGKAILVVDETRQQTAHALMGERLTPDRYLMVTTHGRKMPDVPNWKIGRMTLFSELRTCMARPGVLQVLEPATDDPRIWRGSQIRAALASAQEKPPADEPDSYVTDGTTQDDAALAPDFDYSTMWGAGIGFDLIREGWKSHGAKHVWDPMAVTAPTGPLHRLRIRDRHLPLPGLRVGDPHAAPRTPRLRGTPTRSRPAPPRTPPGRCPYWGAGRRTPNSPVVPAPEPRAWTDIMPPRRTTRSTRRRCLAFSSTFPQCHAAPKGAYTFCITNVKLLRQ